MKLHTSGSILTGLSAALCVTMLASGASAQTPNDKAPTPSIRAVAEATVTAKPDQVEIDIGVTTQAPASKDAAARNAKQLSQVLDALKSALGASATIETINYSLTPQYRYPKDGGKPAITGYTATNTVRVTLSDLDKVGDAVDASAAAGANQIHRVHFMLKDEQGVQAEALRQAAKKAMSQAEALASALDVKIVRVLSVTESDPVVRPFREMAMLRTDAASAETPIQPGTLEVHATVTLTVEIAGR